MAEIKISDMSIGDWVQDILGNICIVRNIFCGDLVECYVVEKGDELGIMIDRLRPIPLTPEILEKNGWTEYSDVHNSWKLDIADNMRVWMFKNSHDWTFQVMNWGLGHNHCMAKAYITSIHQLQNALRLAGVEKEVVL